MKKPKNIKIRCSDLGYNNAEIDKIGSEYFAHFFYEAKENDFVSFITLQNSEDCFRFSEWLKNVGEYLKGNHQ